MAGTAWHPSATRQPLEDAGSFTGGGHKFLGSHDGRHDARECVHHRQRRSAPRRTSFSRSRTASARLVQCIPINRAARGSGSMTSAQRPTKPTASRSRSLALL